MSEMFNGHVNGQIELTGSHIIITRKGILGFLTQGLKGEKRIPYPSVTSIQFKNAGLLTNGYIQFGVAGGMENKRGIVAATQDENTVMFGLKAQASFVHLRETIEQRVEAARNPSSRPTDTVNPIAELGRLAELHKSGVLNETEFASLKTKLLAQ